jgi:hypothetical protein
MPISIVTGHTFYSEIQECLRREVWHRFRVVKILPCKDRYLHLGVYDGFFKNEIENPMVHSFQYIL